MNIKIEMTPPAPPPEIRAVVLTLSLDEARHLKQIAGAVGGSPHRWPQRATFDRLWTLMDNHGINWEEFCEPLKFDKNSESSMYLKGL